MKVYKLLVCDESGRACAILEVQGNKLRSLWLTPELIQAIEKDPLKMKDLEYCPEEGTTEELRGKFRVRASVAVGAVNFGAK